MSLASPLLDLIDSPSFSDDVGPSKLHVLPMTTTGVLHSPMPLQQHIESRTALCSPSPLMHSIKSATAMAPKQAHMPVTMKKKRTTKLKNLPQNQKQRK